MATLSKSKVEQSVLLAQRWVLARLRNQRFFSQAELNLAIAAHVADLNNRIMRAYGASRSELFAKIDAPALKALPPEPFAFATWIRCRLGPDSHVEADDNVYSAPYQLIKEVVDVRVADRTVEVFHKGQRVASHAKSLGKRLFETLPEHMPSAHRRHAAWTPARIMAWGDSIGPAAAALFAAIMADRPHPEQGFRTCLGIIALEDIDMRTPRGIDRALLARLIAGNWIDQHQNCLIVGPCGVGKSWLACALGNKACRDGRMVLYQRVPRLFESLALARGDGRHARLLKTIARTDLLILDDWGLSVLNQNQRIDLLEILEDRNGRGSTIVTSQIPVDLWTDVIGDPTLADACLDRLVHHAHRCDLTGDSMRRIRGKRSLDATIAN